MPVASPCRRTKTAARAEPGWPSARGRVWRKRVQRFASIGETTHVEVGVRLTVVASQGEADVICSLLRAHGIKCAERATNLSAEQGGGWGGQREVLVAEPDLVSAQELLNSSGDS